MINLEHDYNFSEQQEKITKLYNEHYNKNGFYNLASSIKKKEIDKINRIADKIKQNSDVFIVIGAGGSFLGAKAAIKALSNSFHNELSEGVKIYFAGHNLSTKYMRDLLEVIKDKDISVNVISKSGTTLEPSLAFKFIKEFMLTKYSKEELKERIFITTDDNSGLLREFADDKKYTSLPIPQNVGGRYSVLSAVGLLPMAVSNINIEEVLKGAISGEEDYGQPEVNKNKAYQYALIRNKLYNEGKKIEILASYEPSLEYLSKWWQQLFGESEGKESKGIFPVPANFTTDLHSLGQYIQEGERHLFETVIKIEREDDELIIKDNDLFELQYLANKNLSYVNDKAFQGVLEAHKSADVPNIIIRLPEMNEYYLGKLFYFFQIACSMSSHLLNVNPFDQPGVEAYKKNMFTLLGKQEGRGINE